MTAPMAAADRADADLPARPQRRPLGSYRGRDGRARDVVARPGAHGSTLVIDEDAATLADRRLVAHLPADEPATNALLVCRLYLADPHGRFARAVLAADWQRAPAARPSAPDPPPDQRALVDARRRAHRL